MKIPGVRFFQLEELVDKPIFEQYGERSIQFLDRNMVLCMDRLRYFTGRIAINNWVDGGALHESGRRLPDTKIGARLSMHKSGIAFDCHPLDLTVEELYNYIINNRNRFPEITTIENPKTTKGWLHVDGRWTNSPDIQIVEP